MSHRITLSSRAALLFLLLSPPALDAQQRGGCGGTGAAGNQTQSDHALVNQTAARSIGPAVMSGRIVDIAVRVTRYPWRPPRHRHLHRGRDRRGVDRRRRVGTRGGRLGTVIYIAAARRGVEVDQQRRGSLSWTTRAWARWET